LSSRDADLWKRKEEEEKEERKKLTGVRSTNLAKIELINFRSYS